VDGKLIEDQKGAVKRCRMRRHESSSQRALTPEKGAQAEDNVSSGKKHEQEARRWERAREAAWKVGFGNLSKHKKKGKKKGKKEKKFHAGC